MIIDDLLDNGQPDTGAAFETVEAGDKESFDIPSRNALSGILDMLGMQPRDLMRKKEKEYKEAGLDNPDLSRDELIAAMVEHPRLIERPILIANGKAAIGRPPEKVLEIL